MAPPNTSDIFFNLNEFLAQNEGPYKEIHKELEKQGKKLNIDNWNNVISEQGLSGEKPTPNAENYIRIASNLIPPEIEPTYGKLSQAQHDATNEKTREIIANAYSVPEKEEKRVTPGETAFQLDNLFTNITNLADLQAEQDFERNIKGKEYSDEEKRVLRAIYQSAYTSYRLTHVDDFINSDQKIRGLVDEVFRPGMTVDDYAKEFEDSAQEKTLQDFINMANTYNLWAKEKGLSVLNPADPFIARLPAGEVYDIAPNTAISKYLNAQEVLDERIEADAIQRALGQTSWEKLDPSEQQRFKDDSRKYLRNQMIADPNFEQDLRALMESVSKRREVLDYSGYVDERKTVVDISRIGMEIADAEKAIKADRYFKQTEPERERAQKENRSRVAQWQDFIVRLTDAGLYESMDPFGESDIGSLREQFDGAFSNIGGYGADENAMASSQALGITDYDSFVRVTQELFDAQIDDAKRLSPKREMGSWETGFSMPDLYDPLTIFSQAVRLPGTERKEKIPLYDKANLDSLLPSGVEAAPNIGTIDTSFIPKDPIRRMVVELEKEIQFNYGEKHQEWEDFLIQAIGSDDRTSIEKIASINPFTEKEEGIKELTHIDIQENKYADEKITLTQLLAEETDKEAQAALQKRIDAAEALRKKYSDLRAILMKYNEGASDYDFLGMRSGLEVTIGTDFVFEDALEELEETESTLTDDLLKVIVEAKEKNLTRDDIESHLERNFLPNNWEFFKDELFDKMFDEIDFDKEYTADNDVIKELTGIAAREYYRSRKEPNLEESVLLVFLEANPNLSSVKQSLRIEAQQLSDMLRFGAEETKWGALVPAQQIMTLSKKEDLLALPLADVKLKDLPPDLRDFFGPDLGSTTTVRDVINQLDDEDFDGLVTAAKRINAGGQSQTFNKEFAEIVQYLSQDNIIDVQAGTVTTTPGVGMFLFETGSAVFETAVAEMPVALSVDDIYDVVFWRTNLLKSMGYLEDEGPIVIGPTMADLNGGGWDSWMDEWARRGLEIKKRGAGGYQYRSGEPLHPMSWMFDSGQVGEELLQYIKDNYNAQLKEAGIGFLDVKPKISYDQLMKWTDEFISTQYPDHYDNSLPYLDSAKKLFGNELAIAGTNILDHIPAAVSGVVAIPTPYGIYRVPIGGIAGMEAHMERYAGDYYTPTRDLRVGYIDRVKDGITYLDGDFMMGQQQLARGFGISSGPTYNSYTSLGIAQAVMMDYEGMVFGFLGTGTKAATLGGRAMRLLPNQPAARTFTGAALYEVNPLVGGYFIEVTGPKDPSGRYIGRDEAKYQQAVEKINSDPYFSRQNLTRTALETVASATIGYLIGGDMGAKLGAAAFNPASSRALFHAYDLIPIAGGRLRVLDSYYREAGVEKLLSGNGYIYRHDALLRGDNPYVQSINPDTKKSKDAFERSDMKEVIYNLFGLDPVDVAVTTQDVALVNKRTVMALADALMRGQEEVVIPISKKIEQRIKDSKDPIGGLFGMYIGLQKTNGYKKAQRDLIAVASRIGDDVGSADFQLAVLTAAAILTKQDPVKFFESFRVDQLVTTGLDFEMLKQTFPEGASLGELLDSLELTTLYREEAYLKALGLYDFLDRTKVSIEEMLRVEKPIQIDDVLKFIKDAEKYTFIDEYNVDFNSGVKFNPPSEKMKGYTRALISFGDKYAYVYYKLEKGKVTLGEIHTVNPPTEMPEDLSIRLRVSKILTAEKMKEGISKFAWDVDDVFQQLKGDLTTPKREFDIGLRRYFDNFAAKDTRETKLKKIPEKIERSATIGKEVMESYLEHIDSLQTQEAVRTGNPRSKGKAFYVETPVELPVHPSIKQKELDRKIIAEGIIDQANVALDSKKLLEDTDEVSANTYVEQIKKAKSEKELLKYLGKNKNIFDYNELQKEIIKDGLEAVKKKLTASKVEAIIRGKRAKAEANIKTATGRVETAMEVVEIVDPVLYTAILEEDLLSFDPKWEEAFDKIGKAGFDLTQGQPRVSKESKFYRGRSQNEIIMENGNSQLLFRQAEINNERIMFLDAVNTPSSSGITGVSSIYAEIELAKLIRDKKTRGKAIKELKSKLSLARQQLAINPPKELNDLFGDARLALRELLQGENAPDYIGYQADNLAYGSKIRSELKQAGIEFREFLIKDPEGVPFRVIKITDLVQNTLINEGLPVIPTYLDPNLSSLGLDIDNLLETDAIKKNPLVGKGVKRWLGLPEDADVDLLSAKIDENRQQISTIHEDTYAGFSRQEIEELLKEGTIPEDVAKAVQTYLDQQPTTNNYAFVKDGKESSFSVSVKNNEIYILGDTELNDIQIRNIVFEATKDGRSAIHFDIIRSPIAEDTLASLAKSFNSEVMPEGSSLKLTINREMSYDAPARLTPLFSEKSEFVAHEDPTTMRNYSAGEKRASKVNNDSVPGGVYRAKYLAEDVVIYQDKNDVWRIADYENGKRTTRRTGKFSGASKQEAIDQVKSERLVDPEELDRVGILPIVKSVDETIKILHQDPMYHMVVHTTEGKTRRLMAARKKAELDSRTIEVSPKEEYLNGSTVVVNHSDGQFASLAEIDLFQKSRAKTLIIATPTKTISVSGEMTNPDAKFFDLTELIEKDYDSLTGPQKITVDEFLNKVINEIPAEITDKVEIASVLVEQYQAALADELRATGLDVTIEDHKFKNTRGTYVTIPKKLRTGSLNLDYQFQSEGFATPTGAVDKKKLKAQKLASKTGEEESRIILRSENQIQSKLRRAYRTKNVRDYTFVGVEHYEKLLDLNTTDGIPDFVQHIIDNVSINLQKFKDGKLTYRDTLVAYFTSVMSQQAKEMPLADLQKKLSERGQLDALVANLGSHITATSGVNFGFIDAKSTVRMEDMAGAWFVSPKGQAFLDAFEKQCQTAKELTNLPTVKTKKRISKERAEQLGYLDTSSENRVQLWGEDLIELEESKLPAMSEDDVEVFYSHPPKSEGANVNVLRRNGLGLSSAIEDLYQIRAAHSTPSNNLKMYFNKNADLADDFTKAEKAKYDKLLKENYELMAALEYEISKLEEDRIIDRSEKENQQLIEGIFAVDDLLKENEEKIRNLQQKSKVKNIEFKHIDTSQLMYHIILTTDRMNSLGLRYTGKEDFKSPFSKEVHLASRTLQGIGEVKAPFLAMQLGFGVMVTADAQEIRALIGLDPEGRAGNPTAKRNKKIRTNISSFSEAGTRGKILDGRSIDQVYQDAIMENFQKLREVLANKGIELPDENWVAVVHQMVWSSMKKYKGQEKAQNAMYAGFQDINKRMNSDTFNHLLQRMTVPQGLQASLTHFKAAIIMDPDSLNLYQLQVLKTVLEKIPDDRAKGFIVDLQGYLGAIDTLPELPTDYTIDTSSYTNGLSKAQQDKFLIDHGLTQTKDTGVAGSFINTGEVLKIRLGKIADVGTFFHEHGHLIRHLLSPGMYDQIARRFDHVVVNKKARMTRRGEEQFAEAWEHTQINELNSADPIIRRAMDVTKTNLQQVLLLTQRSRIGRGAQGRMSKGLKKLIKDLNPMRQLNRQVEQILKPFLQKNIAEAHEMLEDVISLDAVEGIAKATSEGPIPFKQAFLKATEVMQKDGAARVAEEAKVSRAQSKLVQRVYKTSKNELLRDLRPSRYPSIRYENKLGPERQRAKENIAEREGRSVDEIEDVEVTTEEIDIAFLNLAEEGKPIDLLDFYARIEAYADFRHVQANTNFNYQALTQRTIVRAEDREEYSTRARLKMEQVFGESMEQVAERFGREGEYDPIKDISGMTKAQQKKLDRPFVMFSSDVKARLSHFVDVTHSIRGGALLDGDFVSRVKDHKSPEVQIYITDITDIIRPAIIDNAAPISARRSRSLEAGSVTAAHSILKTLDSIISHITKGDKKFFRRILDNQIVSLLVEDYNPTISSLLNTEKISEKDLDPRILEILNNLQAGLRALPQEIEMILNLLQQENTLNAIERAEQVFGPHLTDSKKKDLKAIGASMMELSRRLQRTFSPPVDPVRIPHLRNIVNRVNGIKAGMISRDFELLLDAEDASLKVEAMMQALQDAGEPMTEPYKLIREYLKKNKNEKKEMSEVELRALGDAQNQMEQRYREISSTREVLSLQTWKNGFLTEVRSILGPEITLLEQAASIDLDEMLEGYTTDQLLTPELTAEATKNISILLTAIERKDHQVRRRGEQLFRSSTGKKKVPSFINPDDIYHAYTMFYTGRIAIGDMDLKRMQGPNKFTLEEPPNKVKWTYHNLIEIYKQFGFREAFAKQKDANLNARADIEKRFNIKDIEKLSEDEIVQYANEVARMPPQDKGFFRSTLIGMAFDRGDVKLSQTPETDLGMVMLEMIVRLMAEEKLAEAASQIAEIHVYGDLQKAAREKMIELGFEPLKEERIFIDRVAQEVENWVNEPPDSKLILNGGLLVYKREKPADPSILAAQQVAAEIISTYGLEPGSKRNMARYTSPDGVEYIIPEGIEKLLEDLEDQVAPVGVAADKTLISPQEVFERKANTRRLQQNLAKSETIKERMVELIIEDYPDQLNNKDAREDLKFLVDTYIIEQNPDSIKLREAMDKIDAIKQAEIADLLDVKIEKAAGDYLKDKMGGLLQDKFPRLDSYIPRIRRKYELGDEVIFQLNIKQELAEAELTSGYIETRRKQRKAEGVEEKYLPTAAAERLTGELKPARPVSTFVQDFFTIGSYLPRRMLAPKRFAEGGLVINWTEAWMRMKKRLVTTGFVIGTAAYYVNNMFGALFQGFLEDGISGLSSNFTTAAMNAPVFLQGMAYLYPSELGGLGRRGNRNSKVFVSRDGRVWTAETLANEAQKHGIGGAFITTELGQSVVEDLRLKNPEGLYKAYALGAGYMDLWTDLAAATDNIFRFAMFMDEIHKGASGAQAAKKVRDAYYDYAALLEPEKKVLRQVFLFYAYMRKNQIQVVRAIRDNPGRVMGILRFIRNSQREAVSQDERGYNYRKLPDYLRARILSPAGRMDFQNAHDVWYYEDIYGQKVHIYPMVGVADAAMMVGPLVEGVIKTFQAIGLDKKIEENLRSVGEVFYEYGKEQVDYFAGMASPPLQMMYELTAGQKIFADIELDRLRVSLRQIEAINSMTGGRMFNTPGDDPLSTGGLINMVQSTYGYEDGVRGTDIYYYPESELDILNLYFALELLSAVPAANLIFGRPQKQTLYIKDQIDRNILGKDSKIPLGFTEWETGIGILSRPTKALRFEDLNDQRVIKDLNKKLEERIKLIQKQQ